MKAPQRPQRIGLMAPLSGVLVPLESVPDPVFAQKMVGDGVSIDPTSDELLSPLTGKVTQLHSSGHATTITADNGLQVLLHIGLDTVLLRGEGFMPLVKEGDAVATGTPLIRFDPIAVGAKATSLLTQMVIANGDLVTRYVAAKGLVVAGTDVALYVELVGSMEDKDTASATGAIFSDEITLPNPAGLHARPAAVVAVEAKKFKSEIRQLRGDASANAKSVVAIMGLATKFGDKLRVEARGPDAAEAASTVARLLGEGSGEKPGDAPTPAAAVKVGVMIEVPAAALIAEPLAREVDFFSIGTNDLTQYTLVMDRGHPQLAKQADALHPAVLRLIGMTVDGAHKHGKWVGICGGCVSSYRTRRASTRPH
ncbi:glucose PTS transporter subunit IIA [Paraburkholderia sp. MM5482-R1]|uniref:glucose PTS transporter subunit IIA n=1 Tax=unclassified Paraburkholderia TaxID=2615204 RepID=UPI003D1A8B67